MNDTHWLPEVRATLSYLGMTQSDLARRLGVHKATVSLWFAGKRRLKPVVRKRIARVLHCTVTELFAKKETP